MVLCSKQSFTPLIRRPLDRRVPGRCWPGRLRSRFCAGKLADNSKGSTTHENPQGGDHGRRTQPAESAAANAGRSRRRGEVRPSHPDGRGAARRRGGDRRRGVAGRRGGVCARGGRSRGAACASWRSPSRLGYGHAICARANSWAPSRSCTWWATISISVAPRRAARSSWWRWPRRRLRGLRRAGDARKPAAALRRGGRAARGRQRRSVPRRDGDREAARPPKPSSAWWCRDCAPDTISASSACTC